MHKRFRINVSGLEFETFEKTLQNFPETLLGSERKRHYYDEGNGEYYFNRNRQIFDSVLFYYQSNGILSRPPHIPENTFLEELRFFKIHAGINETRMSVNGKADQAIFGTEKLLPRNPFQRRMWLLLFRPSTSIVANYIEVLSVFILLISVIISCMETTAFIRKLKFNERHFCLALFIIDHICYGWFTLEYSMRLILVREKLQFMKSWLSIVDLLTIVPFYFQIFLEGGNTDNTNITSVRILRLCRIVRLLKVTRYNRGMRALLYTFRESYTELSVYLSVAFVLNTFCSSLMFYCEDGVENSLIDSIPQAMWWDVNTLTTVGYGDIYPVTDLGKLLGGICSVMGIIILGVPVYCLVSRFILLWEAIKTDEPDILASKLKNSVRRLKSEWLLQTRRFRHSLLRNRRRISFQIKK